MLAMCKIFTFNKIIYFLFVVFVLVPQMVFADDFVVNNDVTISARVNAPNNGGNEGNTGGGGGGGGGNTNNEVLGLPTSINFSGMAYPLSRVYILKDGKIAITTIADQAANFSVSLSGLTTNTYTFSIYGEDGANRKSSFFSFPVYVTAGTTINIGNVFLSPTIDIDKSEVKQGDDLIIFGKSIPKKEVVISVHSDQEYFYKVISNAMGAYLYNLDTSILEIGKHQTKSKTTLVDQVSLYATPISFSVGNENKPKDDKSFSSPRGDLNKDNHVNLVDFSIMAYWYKKVNPPQNVDLNNDRKITLVDFSILAFNWTG